MKSLVFYFVLALYLGARAAEADVSFSMLGANGGAYKQFIKNVRSALTVGSPKVYDIPVLKASAAASARFLLVHLTNYNDESITVAIDVVNVYVVAYRAGNIAYFLNDAPGEADSVLFKGIKHIILSYRGNYDSLENAAKMSREQIPLGFSELSSAIGNMFHHNAGTSVPRAFLVVIQSLSEAARFKYIEQRISENVKTSFKPDPAFLSLENHWSDLSVQIQIAQKQGGKFARPVELRSVSNQVILVTDVSSPVVKGVALLLYYKVSVAPDYVIKMPMETY